MKLLTGVVGVLATVATLLACQRAAAQQPSPSENKSGTICVLPNPPEWPTRISPGGDYNPDTLTVQVDDGKLIPWPHKQTMRIEGLTLDERHLVVLTSDGKRIQSFRFKFANADGARLCMSFDGYQGVQLGNRRDASGVSASEAVSPAPTEIV
jgi:hypothetical protein